MQIHHLLGYNLQLPNPNTKRVSHLIKSLASLGKLKIMASFTSSVTCPTLLLKPSVTAIYTETVYGLPRMIKRSTGVKCSMETKQPRQEKSSTAGSSALAVMLTAVMSSSPAMALVDERMSTEGTGLPFGLSNNLLGWILLGVFGLIWAIYFNYTSSLDEDEDSGLSL